ncbi:MAG: aminotransferase class V-fold PLP-dependent enzyme [Pseudomonadota bacterium]
MTLHSPDLTAQIRNRFAHVDACPFTGPRIFFENAGGALTLKSVVDTSATYAAVPDNQGRDNPASAALSEVIAQAEEDMRLFFNAQAGRFMVGESGTELLFRLIRTAVSNVAKGAVLGSTVEHPASRSAAQHWAQQMKMPYISVPHNDATGQVTAEAYGKALHPEVRVATILHTSPVTGIANDVAEIAATIRAAAPEAFIIVDGIQHASHGAIDIYSYNIDGYVVSPYKMFSRHGYGVAWASDRLTSAGIETLLGGPNGNWSLGTRDTGAYATFSDVVTYLTWLGGQVSQEHAPRARLRAASASVKAHEAALTHAMLHGVDNLAGIADLPGACVLGGLENPDREGLVCFALADHPAAEIVTALNARGIRTHLRRADHYSGNILTPLGMKAAVRVSLCHYNTMDEVRALLTALKEIAPPAHSTSSFC